MRSLTSFDKLRMSGKAKKTGVSKDKFEPQFLIFLSLVYCKKFLVALIFRRKL